jgi:hypothetical protein
MKDVVPLPFTQMFHEKAVFAANEDRSDTVSNSFNFAWSGSSPPLASDFNVIQTAVEAFYNVAYLTQVHPIAYYLGANLDRNANRCENEITEVTHHLDGSAAGSPSVLRAFTLGPRFVSGQDMPVQVSAVCSYRADYGTDPEFGTHLRPRASDRGRIYLGPLIITTTTVDGSTPPKTVFLASFLSDIHLALSSIYKATTGTPATQWSWCVWSRKESLFKAVTELSSDLIPDTTRKRVDARSNLVWAAPT